MTNPKHQSGKTSGKLGNNLVLEVLHIQEKNFTRSLSRIPSATLHPLSIPNQSAIAPAQNMTRLSM
jgi:hypothetical protein